MAAIDEDAPAKRPGITVADITDALKRRMWIPIVTTIIGTTVATGVAYILPPVYEASARILVQSQAIPDALAQSTVTASAAERLSVIRQRLLTRDNLLSVVERLNLYNDKPNLSAGAKVALLRRSTRIRPLRGRGDGRLRGFIIAYSSDNSADTARVANEFVSMVLEQNLKTRSERAAETLDFFRDEVERLTSELLAVESEITTFKRENSAALPGGAGSRQARLNALRAQGFQNSQRRIQLEDRLKDLELALERGPSEGQMSFEERELRKLEREMIRARSMFSDNHPRIRALKTQMDEMGRSAAAAIAAEEGTETQREVNLAALQQRREEKLRAQILLVRGQIGQLDKSEASSATRIETLEAAIEKSPQVEMALLALQRRHTDLQGQYRAAIAKQTAAETGEKLEVNRQAERFEVLEQAERPGAPVRPKRAMIAASGMVGSLGFGLLIVALLEFLNSAIRTPADIERRFGQRPIATVPYIFVANEVRRRRRRMLARWIVVLVVIPAALFAIDRFYLPLSVIAEKAVAQTGINQLIGMIENRF